MKFHLLFIGFLGFAACQDGSATQNQTNPGNGTTAGNGTARAPACDPFLRECPGSDCEQGEPGRLIVIKPGKSTYAYVGIPTNITWIYTQSTDNKTYPISNFVFYYRKKGDTSWRDIGSAGKGNTTTTSYLWNPKDALLKDTRYELLVLVDNVASPGTGENSPGNKPTCYAKGFPIGYPEEFVVLSPPSGPSDPSNPDKCTKFCPADSESAGSSISLFSLNQFFIYLELLGGLFLFYAF